MNIVFFDDSQRDYLLPLTFTRPASELRIGILTIREKWEKRLNTEGSWLTLPYLSKKFGVNITGDNLLINGRVLPTKDLIETINDLELQEGLFKGDILIAARIDEQGLTQLKSGSELEELELEGYDYENEVESIDYCYDLFLKNKSALADDFELLTKGRVSQPIDDLTKIIGDPAKVFIEEGGSVSATILNVEDGPVYIGKNASLLEGVIVRGGLAVCEAAQVKMAAKIYGATTIGPYSKVGGEISNSILIGYSNKGHDGFLGNSVLGEWCNLGADTNNSNLKNNYGEVSLWSYPDNDYKTTGLQFCGLIMGDHSKSGINTMFNTGTVVGVSSNIFGGGFPPKMIPSFAWGGAEGFSEFLPHKAFEVADRMMQRRAVPFDEMEKEILDHVFELTQEDRDNNF
tara:strand:- start:2500 stop:3705 length:1206 start_codon:yes stop_codon:yes gene_type:complete